MTNSTELEIYNNSVSIYEKSNNLIKLFDIILILYTISIICIFNIYKLIKYKNNKILELEIKINKLDKDLIASDIKYTKLLLKKHNNYNNDKIINLAKNICNLFLFEDICNLTNYVKKYNPNLQYDQMEYSRTRSNRYIKLIDYYENILDNIDTRYKDHNDMFYTIIKKLCNNEQTQDNNNKIELQKLREQILLAYIKEMITLI
jgi:hypothetical protein